MFFFVFYDTPPPHPFSEEARVGMSHSLKWCKLVGYPFLLSAVVLQGLFRFFRVVLRCAALFRNYLFLSREDSITGRTPRLSTVTDLACSVWSWIATRNLTPGSSVTHDSRGIAQKRYGFPRAQELYRAQNLHFYVQTDAPAMQLLELQCA